MGFVDVFRKLWGWLSGESAVIEYGSSSEDKVNFLSTTDGTNMLHSTNDKGRFIHTVNDEIDF